jgi:SAM-dependent methyltransferase
MRVAGDAGVRTLVVVCTVTLAGCAAPVGRAALRQDAQAMRALVTTPLARAFVDASDRLPAIGPRSIAYQRPDGTPAVKRIDEDYYYTTRYGSPLAYARPLELLGPGFTLAGKRVLDFGYGSIGQLLMEASLGADATGVDVDPLLQAMYRERNGGFGAGQVRVLTGTLPALKASLGERRFDLIIAKNVLKRGYIHPSQPVSDKERIDLGCDDQTFLAIVHELLSPGGVFLIYNLSPAPAPPGHKYIPWADGRSPFSRELLEKSGFTVEAFEIDDTQAARRMARALGWDRGPDKMDLEHDLFGQWTLARKPLR